MEFTFNYATTAYCNRLVFALGLLFFFFDEEKRALRDFKGDYDYRAKSVRVFPAFSVIFK